jgi:AraC-like DNA-binding protein
MDALSEVLRAITIKHARFVIRASSAPWSLSSLPSTERACMIGFHFITEGRAYASLPERREELAAGDLVIFPQGDAHLLRGAATTKAVCGFLRCDPRPSGLFSAALPKMIQMRSDEWLEKSIRFAAAFESTPGSTLVLAKLAEVLLVETLRRYFNSVPPSQTGWLAGARDPVISQALVLLHKFPARQWTVTNLARRVGLSRTRLAERFSHFMAESPMAYLAQWRLKRGADLLQSTRDNVAEIAEAVGYGSEAAFNRAFKRQFDCPPAQFRRNTRLKELD